MNYYNPYTGSKKKRTLRRVVLVLVSVLIITGGTVIFGNHLKKKANEIKENSNMGVGREDIFAKTESQLIIPPSEGGAGSSESVKGQCVLLGAAGDFSSDVAVETSADEVGAVQKPTSGSTFEERLLAAAEGNTGILIPLTGDDGYLLYNSVRARESSRLPENPALPGMTELSSAVAMAKAKGLRVSALVKSGVSLSGIEDDADGQIAADSRIAADAAEAGFDEIIISSLVAAPEDITGENSHIILRYLNQMTAAAGEAEVGLSLPPDVYLNAKLSPQIELFISRSVFLTMELGAEQSTLNYINFVCENLAGTLSVYNMRILFSPVDTAVGESIEGKLAAVSHENFLYASVPDVPPEEPEDDGTDGTDAAESDTAEPDSTDNTDEIPDKTE